MDALRMYHAVGHAFAAVNGDKENPARWVDELTTLIQGPNHKTLNDAISAMERIGVKVQTNG
jgi:hypothetical protein